MFHGAVNAKRFFVRPKICERRRIDTLRKLHTRAKAVDSLVEDLKKADAIRGLVNRAHESNELHVSARRLAGHRDFRADSPILI